jgi:hypothetical protein
METMDDPLNSMAADSSVNPFTASSPSGGSGQPAASTQRSDFAAAASHGAAAVAVAGQGVEKLTFAIKDISSAPLPRLVTYMRWANVAVASLMVCSAVLTILASAASLATVVIAVYVSCFGCLLCTFESHLSLFAGGIAENFGFMYSARGRFGFLVLLSTLCFSLNLIGKVGSSLPCGMMAVLNTALFLYLSWPVFAEVRCLSPIVTLGCFSIPASPVGNFITGSVYIFLSISGCFFSPFLVHSRRLRACCWFLRPASTSTPSSSSPSTPRSPSPTTPTCPWKTPRARSGPAS